MFNWLWKRLGYHVCEKFSPWRRKLRPAKAVTTHLGVIVSEVPVIRRYQERRCLECKKSFREMLL